jgi:AraC-like DNA-binding protein
VYEFFKDMRLETAREMLASGHWNVTEAAKD